jgi:hypothetical protein
MQRIAMQLTAMERADGEIVDATVGVGPISGEKRAVEPR